MTLSRTERTDLANALRARLEEASAMIFARDLAIVNLFWRGGQFWLFGSEANQQSLTREELRANFAAYFTKPYRIRFVFGEMLVEGHADMAWANVDVVLEVHHADRVAKSPYRLFALFQRIGGAWCWRVFSGSEPAPPP